LAKLQRYGRGYLEAETKSGSATVGTHHASATIRHDCSSDAISHIASKGNHPGVPKHETENRNLDVVGRATSPDSHMEIARLRDELRKTKSDLQEELKQKGRAVNDLLEVLREAGQRNAELAAGQKVLEIVKKLEDEIETVQGILKGRAFNDVDDIGFERILHTNLETDVRMTRTFRLDAREWLERGNLRKTRDRAAVAYMRAFGNIYIAKAGQNPSKDQGFINSNHWTSQAVILSRQIGSHLNRNFATHVEPQLIALYITQYLKHRGFHISDFGDPKTYSNSVLVQLSRNDPIKIRIYVSQAICESCQRFVSAVNQRMSGHAYQFVLKDAQEFADQNCDDELCNACRR
jgi:hypothetical protein